MNNQFLEFGARQLLQENYDKESLVVVRPRPSYPFIKIESNVGPSQSV